MAFETATEEDLVRGLVRGYADGYPLDDELERLGIRDGRRFVSLADDYAGYLVAKALGGRKDAAGRSVIVQGDQELIVQVRGAQRTQTRRPKYFPVDYSAGLDSLHALALVLFDADWTVYDSYMIMRKDLGRLIVPGKKRRGYRLPIGGSWRSDPAVLSLSL